ncbi:MAG: hypothetical protein KGJ13_03485 [Patescibacteria group bacterium]|nr:hypothetical protein [Patescibacteria group bacterium]
MAVNTTMTVRLSQESSERLKLISIQSGLSFSDLIRIATEKNLDEVESAGGISIPLREPTVPYRTNSEPSTQSQAQTASGKLLKKATSGVIKKP